ncbi:MAG: YHS domain-containing (seleno)protein [Hyphomicrobiaceae bacterium]
MAEKVIAAPQVYTATKEKLAVSGYDPVAYFSVGAPTKGLTGISTVHQGVTWRFANEANKAEFLAQPAKYAPQYGGYCAYAVSQGYTASADPNAWEIVDGKLYLNYSRSVAASWSKQARAYIKSGDAHWAKRPG